MDRARHASHQAALIAALALAACVPPPTHVPMRTIGQRAAAPVKTLIVFLPGRGSGATTFLKEGFDAMVRSRGVAADLVFADATEGYYFDRTIVERLHTDVLAKARRDGYERIWIVGISLGGFGAILCARDHPDEVDGVLLLAPYLGDASLTQEIERGGGLVAWDGPYAGAGWEGSERTAWSWLREHAGAEAPALWLGYGRDDRLRDSHALLAAALPAKHVLTAGGGHAWPAWKTLFASFLAEADLTSAPAD